MKTLAEALRNLDALDLKELSVLTNCGLVVEGTLSPMGRRVLRGQGTETDLTKMRAYLSACYRYVRPRACLKSPIDCGHK